MADAKIGYEPPEGFDNDFVTVPNDMRQALSEDGLYAAYWALSLDQQIKYSSTIGQAKGASRKQLIAAMCKDLKPKK